MLRLAVALLLLHAAGVGVFMSGFLLTRTALPDAATCPSEHWAAAEEAASPDGVTAGCYPGRRFKRAVLVLIDALRHDMAEYDPGLPPERTLHYLNKLPVIHELLCADPDRARLYRFVADAPTTTMQRIKGLTTGGLPTFVDSGENFASQAVEEDSILALHAAAGRNATVMGDDTWVGLFPGAFGRAFPFPSFNVRDLDTVDRGVGRLAAPELARPDWGVLIAHYLGVDHCGHRFGPDHPAMAVKLGEMNSAIRNFTERLPDDAVLLVFGDHGMTAGGDHGGDSPNELHSALFVYTRGAPLHRRRPSSSSVGGTDSVDQIDLAPTLAFMLGLPVPFGSIGLAVPELAAVGDPAKMSEADVARQFAAVARANALQVRRYLERYACEHSDLGRDVLDELEADFAAAESALPNGTGGGGGGEDAGRFAAASDAYSRYVRRAQSHCRDIWSTFDVGLIVAGLAVMAGTAALVALELFATERLALSLGIIVRTHRQADAAAAAGGGESGLGGTGGASADGGKDGDAATGVEVLPAEAARRARNAASEHYRSAAEKALLAHDPPGAPNVTDLVVGAVAGALVGGGVGFAGLTRRRGPTAVAATAVGALGTFLWRAARRGQYGGWCEFWACAVGGGDDNGDDELAGSRRAVAAVAAASVGLYSLCCFSNSFVVHQDAIVAFFAASVLLAMAACELVAGGTASAALFAASAAFVRLSRSTGVCREEQAGCVPDPLVTAQTGVFVSLAAFALLRYMREHRAGLVGDATRGMGESGGGGGGGDDDDVGSGFWRRVAQLYGPLMCIGAHWCLDFAAEHELSAGADVRRGGPLPPALRSVPGIRQAADFFGSPFGQRLPALAAYALCAWALARAFASPVPVGARLHGVRSDGKGGVTVELSADWALTSLTTPFVTAVGALVWLLLLLLDAPAVPGAIFALLQACVFLGAKRASVSALPSRQQPSEEKRSSVLPEYADVAAWFLLTVSAFYATGHQPTFPAVQWPSGVVGVGDGAHAASGVLIGVNTWGVFLAMATALPMLVVWSPVGTWAVGAGAVSPDARVGRGSEGSVEVGGPAIRRAVLVHQLAFAATTLLSASAAAMHRRHLMVWKIFAPRVIFDCASLLVSSVGTVVGLALAGRVTRALDVAILERVREVDAKSR